MMRYGLEPVYTCWNEVMELANQHWAGTKRFTRHEPFNPSFDRYCACNESGFFQLFTARDEGKLVGYFGMYLAPSMHSQLLMATEDTFYIHPDYRKGRNAVKFIKYIEDQCVAWGVHEIMFSCEMDNTVANKLLEYLDYEPVIMQYRKRLAVHPCADSAQLIPKEDSHVRS